MPIAATNATWRIRAAKSEPVDTSAITNAPYPFALSSPVKWRSVNEMLRTRLTFAKRRRRYALSTKY